MNILQTMLLIVIGTVIFLTASCRTGKQNQNYLSADKRDSSAYRLPQDREATIKSGDRLGISVLALNPASVQPYSLAGGGATGGSVTVDQDGWILYPQLGRIKVAGLTRKTLKDLLIDSLDNYLKGPTVEVEFLNFKVTIIGEVGGKGLQISAPDGRLTIFEAIAQSGDLSLDARRDSVMVIREENGKREFGYLNLLSNQVFASPYFQLQQNDVVIVPMSKSKAYVNPNRRKNINFTIVSSILGIVSTLAFLIQNITR